MKSIKKRKLTRFRDLNIEENVYVYNLIKNKFDTLKLSSIEKNEIFYFVDEHKNIKRVKLKNCETKKSCVINKSRIYSTNLYFLNDVIRGIINYVLYEDREQLSWIVGKSYSKLFIRKMMYVLPKSEKFKPYMKKFETAL